jgi:hypothetical protein
VLRLAPVDTWPPVDLRSEAGDVVEASLQPDRSAWSRRHAALRRIDEMPLSDAQLECVPGPPLHNTHGNMVVLKLAGSTRACAPSCTSATVLSAGCLLCACHHRVHVGTWSRALAYRIAGAGCCGCSDESKVSSHLCCVCNSYCLASLTARCQLPHRFDRADSINLRPGVGT